MCTMTISVSFLSAADLNKCQCYLMLPLDPYLRVSLRAGNGFQLDVINCK